MSPNDATVSKKLARSPIAARVLKLRNLTHEERDDGIVIAHSEELIVHTGALSRSGSFLHALRVVADRVGSLAELLGPPTQLAGAQPDKQLEPDYDPDPNGPLSNVEIWRLKDTTTGHSLDVSRDLRAIAERDGFSTPDGLPAIHPHHVAILCPSPGGCPATAPSPDRAPKRPFVQQPSRESTAKVTILDSGYIWTDRDTSHRNLNDRVTVVRGQWLDTKTGVWKPDEPDGLYTDPDGQLDGISGHGTFIAGLVSNLAPGTRLEVVGLRNQEVEIGPLGPRAQLRLYGTEVAIAHAMLRRCRTDVIQCGFAFPTLDDYPSLPFAAVMKELRTKRAPHDGGVAVVSPAGNEGSCRPYWPAALPDVIGVASTDPKGKERAWFSNWGKWCKCSSRGEDVYSTFVYWHGSVQGKAGAQDFDGWATWNGTSFAAPKVSAAIAAQFAEGAAASPVDAWEALKDGKGDVQISTVTDKKLCGSPVDLPYLHL